MNMIEKVARAIAENDFAIPNYKAQARAAIEAMREPTDAIVEAGVEEANCYEMYTPEVTDCWKAMINAALKEE